MKEQQLYAADTCSWTLSARAETLELQVEWGHGVRPAETSPLAQERAVDGP